MAKDIIIRIYLDLDNFIYILQYLPHCGKYLGAIIEDYYLLKMKIKEIFI